MRYQCLSSGRCDKNAADQGVKQYIYVSRLWRLGVHPRALAELASMRPTSRLADGCPLMSSPGGERSKLSLEPLPTRAMIPFTGALPHDLIPSQTSCLLTPSHWGLGFQHKTWESHSVHTDDKNLEAAVLKNSQQSRTMGTVCAAPRPSEPQASSIPPQPNTAERPG